MSDVDGQLDERTVAVYVRALSVARAALAADPGDADRAGRDELLDVTDPAELMRIAGALAWLAVHRIPETVAHHGAVPLALDQVHLEVLMRSGQ